MISATVLISCTSTQNISNSPFPVVTAPDPIPAGSVTLKSSDGTITVTDKSGKLIMKYDPSSDTVTMAFWLYQKFVRYVIDTQAAQKINDYNSGGIK